MTLRQRQPRAVDEAHLKFVRSQPCCIPYCNREAEAAHLRMENRVIGKRETGAGERPSDCYVTALCPYHHRTGIDCQHNSNEKEWWERTGLNPWAIAASLWIESGGAARSLEPKRAKRRPKLRESDYQPHKPKRPKRQIPGRAMQSRLTFPHGRKMQSRNTFERRP